MPAPALPRILRTTEALKLWRAALSSDDQDSPAAAPLLGFVPATPVLHAGQMSLIDRAAAECRHVLVAICASRPPSCADENHEPQPASMAQDLVQLGLSGIEAVFHPEPSELCLDHSEELTPLVLPARLTNCLCGHHQPGYIEDSAKLIFKLFAQVMPDRAYLGEKDYQLLTIVRQLVRDSSLAVELAAVPILREPDGLAFSSRNQYLSARERQLAPCLYLALSFVREQVRAGALSLQEALRQSRERLAQTPGLTVEYLEACDPDTLEPLSEPANQMVLLGAARFGTVRLIDNLIVR